MKVTAKFTVNSVTTHAPTGPESVNVVVKLSPVTRGSGGENADWSKYTPCGVLEMTITEPQAASMFEPGKDYLLTFDAA